MKQKIYWVCAVFVILTGMTFIVYYGIAPRPVPKIKLSQFVSADMIVNSLVLRLNEEFKKAPVLIFGVATYDAQNLSIYKEVISKFIDKTNSEPQLKYSLSLMDASLASWGITGASQILDVQENFNQIREQILSAAPDKRILILTPSSYSTQLLQESLVRSLKKAGAENFMSMTLSPFARNREQEAKLEPPCKTSEQSTEGLWPCMVLKQSRLYYRKHFSTGNWVGMVNQVGMTDYMFLLTREP